MAGNPVFYIVSGKVDFERFFEFINRTDYKGDFTVGATAIDSEGVFDVMMLNEQVRYIKKNVR